MNKFEIEGQGGLYIRHCIRPRCLIEVIRLPSEAYYEGGLGAIFDLFIYRTDKGNVLFQLLVIDFDEPGILDADDVSEVDTPSYRLMLKKAWHFLLYKYLLPGVQLPGEPRYVEPDDPDDEESLFSLEVEDDDTYVYHRGTPLFRAKLKPVQDAMGILEEIEMLDDAEVDQMEYTALMREMGDWLAKHL